MSRVMVSVSLVVGLASLSWGASQVSAQASGGQGAPAAPDAVQPPPPPAEVANPLPPPPPPVPVAQAPAPVAQAPAPVAQAPACVPGCREGFMCVDGQCVSACNPPCAPGERCTGYGCELPERAWHPGDERGAETHDGFMLRLTIGVGGGSASETISEDLFAASILGGTDFTYSGVAIPFSLDLGGSPVDNLVVHARLASFTVLDPKVSLEGEDLGEADDVSLGFGLLGLGLTYYFMPVNLYLTGVVGLATASVRQRGSRDDGDNDARGGIGVNFDLGKEWWVSDNWGLGLAGRFWYASFPDNDISEISFVGVGALFSATYQ